MKRLIKKPLIQISLFLIFNFAFLYTSLYTEFNNSKWLDNSNPHKINKTYLYDEFDRGEDLIISVDLGKPFFLQDIFTSLKKLTLELEEIEGVIEVKTPLQSTTIIQKNDQLQIVNFGDALEKGIITDIEEYKKRFIQSEYFGRLLSKDLSIFSIIVKLDAPPDKNNFEIRDHILDQSISLLHKYPDFSKNYFSGETELNHQLDINSRRDMLTLLPICAILIIGLLYFIFKSILKAILIISTAVSTLLATFAVSVLQGHPITVLGTSLPVLILVIAIADAIHIMTRWQSLHNRITDQKLLLKETILQTWIPCLMTTVTTSIGFGAFYFSKLIPLNHFGADSAISIFLAYCIIMATMWSGLHLAGPFLHKKQKKDTPHPLLDQFLHKVYLFSMKYYSMIIVFTIAIMLFSAYLLRYVYTETNFLDVFFKKKSNTYQSFEHIDQNLGGTGSVDIIFKEKQEDAFKKVSSLKNLVDIERKIQEHNLVKYTQSYLNPIRMIHKEFRRDKSDLPSNEAQLEQEILFLEFSRGAEKNDVLSPYIDFTYQNSRMHIQTPNLSSTLSRQIQLFIHESLKKFNLEYVLTGSSIYFEILSSYVIDTQIMSIIITTIFIWILFIYNFGLKLGSLGIIPNVLPILVVTGLIAGLKIPFDFATVLITSISFGLCVDDSIHFVHYYKLRKEAKDNLEQSIKETVKTLGRPLVYTTILFCIGFSVFMASDMVILIKFGIFTLIALVMALFSNIMILPAFLRVFDKK